jgi:hypothetical protein
MVRLFEDNNIYRRALGFIQQGDSRGLWAYYHETFDAAEQKDRAIYQLILQLIADPDRDLDDIKCALFAFIRNIDDPIFQNPVEQVQLAQAAGVVRQYLHDLNRFKLKLMQIVLCGNDRNRFTILHQAAYSNKPDVFAYLLEKFRGYLLCRDRRQRTVWDCARDSRNNDIETHLRIYLEARLTEATVAVFNQAATELDTRLIGLYLEPHWFNLMKNGRFDEYRNQFHLLGNIGLNIDFEQLTTLFLQGCDYRPAVLF